jgi:DNA-binding SARP family transcriptional activator
MQRALLAVLLVNANQVVSADRLLEEMWGDRQPSGGVKTLQYHVSKLRDVLEPDRQRGEEGVVVTEAGGYVLRVEPGQVDAARFETLAAEGAALLDDSDADLARDRLVEALGLWRGGAYEDFRYDGFAQGEIARLEELRLVAIENRIVADLELGHHRDLVGELRALTTRYPLRERLWGQLMVALYRSDQQAEALRAYQTARTVLGEELGIEPNVALQRLEEQILLHELPFEPPEAEPAPSDNLPARTSSFIGRHDHITQVQKLFGQRRLVTRPERCNPHRGSRSSSLTIRRSR